MIYCFSGTGNSLRAARLLAQELKDEVVLMTEAAPERISADKTQTLGFVFPVYAWGLPRVVSHFIRQLPPAPKNAPRHVYAVLTCGDDIGCTDRLLRNALKERGYRLAAVYSVQMRNTYVCLPGFDVDSPRVEQSKTAEAEKRLHAIARNIAHQRPSSPEDVMPGSWPRLKSYVLRPLFNRFLTSDRHFRADTSLCTGCGRCTRLCPLHNIRLDPVARTPLWRNHCTHCLACYHCCPHHAISYGKFTKGKGQVAINI